MTTFSRIFTRGFVALAAVGLLFASVQTSLATDDGYTRDGENPFRLAYYFLAPVGKFLEWTIIKPLAMMSDATIPPVRPSDQQAFLGCSRERPSRSCTEQIR